jgi:hypothetical protein
MLLALQFILYLRRTAASLYKAVVEKRIMQRGYSFQSSTLVALVLHLIVAIWHNHQPPKYIYIVVSSQVVSAMRYRYVLMLR